MTRRQAKRRKPQKAVRFQLPKIPLARVVTPLVAAGIDFAELCWRILQTSIADQSETSHVEAAANDA